MGYYMGGDRDDFGNYTPTVVKPKFKTKTQFEIKKGIELPAEFDPDFYTQKQSEFGKFSPDYWEWKKFSDFSSAVYAFYRQAVMQFYEKFPPKSPLSKLEETAIGIKKEDLHELANNVKAAENNLISQFDKSSRSLSAKIKKYAQLMRLREYAAQAWVMFEAINKKLYVADAVKFKNRYNNFNLNVYIN